MTVKNCNLYISAQYINGTSLLIEIYVQFLQNGKEQVFLTSPIGRMAMPITHIDSSEHTVREYECWTNE